MLLTLIDKRDSFCNGTIPYKEYREYFDEVVRKVAARDQEILKILEGCKKHCPNCEGDPEEWSGDECNKEWNGALDTAIGALVEETDVK